VERLKAGELAVVGRRALLGSAASVLLGSWSRHAHAAPFGLSQSSQRDKKSPPWLHGIVDVATPPDEVWRRLQPIEGWAKTFTDIKWISVKARTKDNIRVRLETRDGPGHAHGNA
jgi:hypothetical protein